MVDETIVQHSIVNYHPNPMTQFGYIPIVTYSTIGLSFRVVRILQHSFDPFVANFRVISPYHSFIIPGSFHFRHTLNRPFRLQSRQIRLR